MKDVKGRTRPQLRSCSVCQNRCDREHPIVLARDYLVEMFMQPVRAVRTPRWSACTASGPSMIVPAETRMTTNRADAQAVFSTRRGVNGRLSVEMAEYAC